MAVFHRSAEKIVLKRLKSFPAVYVNGPRQAGKTTLVRELLAKKFKGQFVTFDDLLERAAATRNPGGWLEGAGRPLIIDEVQMVPDIFSPLKKIIDDMRFSNLTKGKEKPNSAYLLTGSASLWSIPKLADAMVGRMATVTLYPLSAAEINGGKDNFLEQVFKKDFTGLKPGKASVLEAIQKATYPELMGLEGKNANDWFQNYLRKITLEDPQQIYNLEKSDYMPILLQALATRVGNLLNDADLARDVGLTAVTTRTYRHLLQATFIAMEMKPWFRNVNKRLVKAGKVFFYDTPLLCRVLRSTPEAIAAQDPKLFGHVLENFIATELIKQSNNADTDIGISFYRTRDGGEVDFILENEKKKLVAVEVKNSETISDKDLRGIKEFQNVAGKDLVCSVILCNTPRVLSYGDNIWLVPISALWS